MNTRPDGPEAVTTALSTLTARVAVLERWMRRSRRREMALAVLALITLTVCAVLLKMR